MITYDGIAILSLIMVVILLVVFTFQSVSLHNQVADLREDMRNTRSRIEGSDKNIYRFNNDFSRRLLRLEYADQVEEYCKLTCSTVNSYNEDYIWFDLHGTTQDVKWNTIGARIAAVKAACCQPKPRTKK